MLQITVPKTEIFNENTNQFLWIPETTIQMEHSLVSLSKWEEKSTAYLEISSVDVGEAAMAAIEKVLYGDATTDPRLPLPDEIAQIITEAQAA